MSSTSAVAVLAQGLRELRDFAEGPDGEELQQSTGLTAQQIQAALGGEQLPTREVTLALVEAWEGDVEAWREYWGQISELAEEDEAGRKKKATARTPTPPEPSIITPVAGGEDDAGPEDEEGEDGEPEPAEDGAGAEDAEAVEAAEGDGGAEPEAGVDEAAAEQEVARARSAARAQLEANAQATKAQSEAKADAEAKAEAIEAIEAVAEAGAEAEAAAEAREEPAEVAGEEPDAAKASGAGKANAAAEAPIPAQRTAKSSEDATAKTQPSAVLEGVVVAGGTPKPAKNGMLARVGIPILVFAIGVGVGAFGDHALNSKQSSTDSSASLPPASATSTSPSKPSHSAASSPSSPSGTPSSVGDSASGSASSTDTAGTGASGTDSTASSSSTVVPGTALGAYVGIQLASGYSVSFLNDPYHPAAGTSNGPDTMGFFASSFVDGRFYADRVAILDSTDTGSYTSCLNDTRYQHDVLLSQVAAGGSFCITTGTGHVVLVTVRRMPSSTDANPYAVLDVTVWQGN